MPRNIKQEIHSKLNDPVLRSALDKFAREYPVSREKAYANVDDIDKLRESVKEAKCRAVENIQELADQFLSEAAKRGAKVFKAADGDAVKTYLLDLCKEKGVKRIVKSKSMATEEIHLNDALIAAGLHVKETDLGEWILSIAGHKPSHMVLPAIHLNRQQIAEYFSKELNRDIDPDVANMVQVARTQLREEFLQADLGITGANFGIAENGAIGLVTNEGNARLVTTLPSIHVVIIGYEKLIASLKDAVPILRTLPRNATGQLMTSYMSMISGPVPTLVKEDGKWVEKPKELHIILLDNGRLKILDDPKFRQVFQCVRCASCLNVCPVYTLVGGHVYGHIYAGGIGAVLTAFLHSMRDFENINELCIGCRRCTTICPGKIDIPGLIEDLRAKAVAEHGLPASVKFLFEKVISNRKVFHALLRAGALGQKPVQSGQFIRHLPWFLSGLTRERSLPTIAAKPLRDRIQAVRKTIAKPVKRAAFFSGCNLDFVYPETGEAVIKVLQALNIDVVYPEEQSCCGKPLIGMGDTETTKKIAKRNIEVFEKLNVDYIIAACPTCTETWLHTYIELFKDEPEWQKRAQKLADKVKEFSQLVNQYSKALPWKKTGTREKVTFHDSCHSKRGLGISEEPRNLLKQSGCELIEMTDADKCCGMAGAFGVKHAELSMPILNKKLTNIEQTGAKTVVVSCPACMMQLKGGLDKKAPGIKVKHLADILLERIKY